MKHGAASGHGQHKSQARVLARSSLAFAVAALLVLLPGFFVREPVALVACREK